MAEEIFTATAKDLMTPTVEGKAENLSAGVVRDWMNENEYTAAPIYRANSDEPVGYVEVNRIEDENADIRSYLEHFSLRNIISTGASFEEVLEALCRRYFYFLGGADNLTGIITRADVNKTPTYIHLYERITYFEELLRERFINWDEEWKSYLDDGSIGSIEGRKKQHSGLNLEEVYYANFRHLTRVVEKSDLYKSLGFDSAEDASNVLNKVADLRNDVAHRKLILEAETIKNESELRNIVDLAETFENLMMVIRELEPSASTSVLRRTNTLGEHFRTMYAGTCQVCGSHDFNDDHPITEVAHILPLRKGGPDTSENYLNLCPNHHRQFDYGQLAIDAETLKITDSPNGEYVGNKLILMGNHNPSAEYIRRHNNLVTEGEN